MMIGVGTGFFGASLASRAGGRRMFWWQGGGEKKRPNLSALNTVSRQLQGEGACEDDTEKQDAAGFVKFCNLWTLPHKKNAPKNLYALPA